MLFGIFFSVLSFPSFDLVCGRPGIPEFLYLQVYICSGQFAFILKSHNANILSGNYFTWFEEQMFVCLFLLVCFVLLFF